MISNKDAIIFDIWSHAYLIEPENSHHPRSLEPAQEMVEFDDEFVLSFDVYDSILLRTLYGY